MISDTILSHRMIILPTCDYIVWLCAIQEPLYRFLNMYWNLLCTKQLTYVCLFPFSYNMLLNVCVFNVIMFLLLTVCACILEVLLCAWLFESIDPGAFCGWVCCGVEWWQWSAVWLVLSAETWGLGRNSCWVSGASWK